MKRVVKVNLGISIGVGVLFAGLAILLLHQVRANRKLRDEKVLLAQEAAKSQETSQVARHPTQQEIDVEELARLRTAHLELIRLRGKVNYLGRQLEEEKNRSHVLEADRDRLQSVADQTNASVSPIMLGKHVSVDTWRDVGQSSPGAALQSVLWAGRSRDVDRFADMFPDMTPERRARWLALYSTPEAWEGYPWVGAQGFTVLAAEKLANGDRFYCVKFDYPDKEDPLAWNFNLTKEETNWKIRQLGRAHVPPPRVPGTDDEPH
jgi:hypothetical protein